MQASKSRHFFEVVSLCTAVLVWLGGCLLYRARRWVGLINERIEDGSPWLAATIFLFRLSDAIAHCEFGIHNRFSRLNELWVVHFAPPFPMPAIDEPLSRNAVRSLRRMRN